MNAVRPRVLIAAPARSPHQIALLEEAGCDVHIVADPIAANLEQDIVDAEAVCLGIIDMPAELLARAPRLKVVARQGSGTDMVDTDAADRLGIWVANTPGANADAVAEFTIGALFSAARRITAGDHAVKAGKWRDPGFFGPELAGRRIAVFGLGKIGSRVARMCRALGMDVVAYDPYQKDPVFAEVGAARATSLASACEGAIAVLVHAAPSAESTRALDAACFAALSDGAVLVNVARSDLVDGDALLAALDSGRLAAAALDVFDEEPPVDRRLADHPCVIATPHTAAWSYEARERMTVDAAKEVIRCLSGQPPTAPVNSPPDPRNLRGDTGAR